MKKLIFNNIEDIHIKILDMVELNNQNHVTKEKEPRKCVQPSIVNFRTLEKNVMKQQLQLR